MQSTQLILSDKTTLTYAISASEGIQHEFVTDYYNLRRRIFVEDKGWSDLTTLGNSEVDEYDSSNTIYVISVNRLTEKVIAGVRLNQTDAEAFLSPMSEQPTSYMIRDAFLGRLENIPASICDRAPPISDKTVEATRLISQEPGHLLGLIRATEEFLRSKGLTQCLFLTHPTFHVIAKRMKYELETLGPIHGSGKDRIQAYSYLVRCHKNGDIEVEKS